MRAFTDLKRHDLSDADFDHFANEQVPQGKLNGFAPQSDFTIPAPPRPTREFLTRKLWDVGNTGPYGHRGDLTLITDAIEFHGGEARASRDAFFALPRERRDEIIEFLKSLQILPDGAPRILHEGGPGDGAPDADPAGPESTIPASPAEASAEDGEPPLNRKGESRGPAAHPRQ